MPSVFIKTIRYPSGSSIVTPLAAQYGLSGSAGKYPISSSLATTPWRAARSGM
jgi:hypothetical protein